MRTTTTIDGGTGVRTAAIRAVDGGCFKTRPVRTLRAGWAAALALCAVSCASPKPAGDEFEVAYYRMERERAGFNDRYRDRSGVMETPEERNPRGDGGLLLWIVGDLASKWF